MTRWKLVLNSLKHYRWLNVAVIAGVAVTSAILSGALVVGDSVKESLRQNAAARISKAEFALVGGERFFTIDLANRLTSKLDATVAPVLQTVGTASLRDNSDRANGVQIVGVTPHFWGLANSETEPLGEGEAAINETLAEELGIGEGDSFVARVELPGLLSKDAVLSGATDEISSEVVKVTRVVGPSQFGRYLLAAEQIPVPTIFLPIEDVQEMLEKPDSANVILFGESKSTFDETLEAIESSWKLEDAALSLKQVETGEWRLSSGRVFVDTKVEAAVEELFPKSRGVLTYLVNTLSAGENETPYSMVTAVDEAFAGDLTDDTIVVSDWLAEDLGVGAGDEIQLEYFVMGNARKLEEKSATFKLRGVRKIEDDQLNRDWTPDFPGVADADSTRDWRPGMPIDRDRIRDKDETFWEEHRTTPKAFVSLAAGQEIWVSETVEHRFGRLTAILIPENSIESAAAFESALREKIGVGELGFMARNLQAESAAAVTDSFDFGMLFASMSGFLIIAALILTALVFVFGIEQRRNQIGLLLALGMLKKKVRGAFLLEATVLAIIGATVGLAGGMIYTKLALSGLGGAWDDAAKGIEFVYSATAKSLLSAWGGTIFLALLVVWLSASAVSRVQPSQLISGSDSTANPKHLKIWFWAGLTTCVVCAIAGVAFLFADIQGAAMIKQLKFFGAGFLLVVAGLGFALAILTRMQIRDFGVTSLGSLGRANAVRRKGRSLAVVTLMAAGVFMVTAINSLRLSGQNDAGLRSSGTGGFPFLGETTLPVYEDLNTDEGREQFGISIKAGGPDDFEVVQFRVSQGEDASCLNLNRAQRPRVLGVDSSALAERGAFFFSRQLEATGSDLKGKELSSAWQLLDDKRPAEPIVNDDGSDTIQAEFAPVVPGMIDEATATYALKKSLGDLVDFETADGRKFHIQLVGFIDNSIFQGSIVISEENFLEFFPDQPGYRFFLLEGNSLAKLATSLRAAGQSVGQIRGFLEEAIFAMGSEDRGQQDSKATFSEAIQLGLSGKVEELQTIPEGWPNLRKINRAQFEVLWILNSQDWSEISMKEADRLIENALNGEEPAYVKVLSRQLQDRGLAITETWSRLNKFNAVQNTYLSIFSTLGGLGILLGTIGLGVVVSRNILERKGQMGLLEAVGFPKDSLGRLVVSEHWFLHVFGVLSGIAAAFISIIPTLSDRSTGLPVSTLVSLNLAILVGGLIFCWVAARWMLRAELIESLRHE